MYLRPLARQLYKKGTMRIAIPVHMGRVSPLLDVAERFLLFEVQAGRELWRQEVFVQEGGLGPRARALVALQAPVIICGGISLQLEQMLASSGVRLVAQTCGPVQEVMDAYLRDGLTGNAFSMPGRARRRRRHRGGRGNGGRGRSRRR